MSSSPAAERETAAFLAVTAELSFFSAILGAYLVLKRSDQQSAQICFRAALAIIAMHLFYGVILVARYAKQPALLLTYYGSAVLLMGLMAAIARLY